MILHWLKTYEKIDAKTMEEVYHEKENGLIHRGRIIKFCPVCRQWVSSEDYQDFCRLSMHERSIPIEVGTEVLVSRDQEKK